MSRSLLLVLVFVCRTPAVPDELRMNQIQVIGTHNSYHVEPSEPMLKLIGMTNQDLPRTLKYTHRLLPEQFVKLGMRQIEIDLFADPNGGVYANPR